MKEHFQHLRWESTLHIEDACDARHPVPLVPWVSVTCNALYCAQGPPWQPTSESFLSSFSPSLFLLSFWKEQYLCEVHPEVSWDFWSVTFLWIPQEIAIRSCAESLLLLLEGDGNLYFKPIYKGTSSTRMYTIKNCTRLPMAFTWKIQQSDSKVLSVRPATGFLQPCEAMVSSGSTKTVFCSLQCSCGVFRAEIWGLLIVWSLMPNWENIPLSVS